MQVKKISIWYRSVRRTREWRFAAALKQQFPHAELYLVGGVVRDLLLGREAKDLDFVVTNVPAAKLKKFLQTQGQVDLVGKAFGVFKFVPHGSHGLNAIDIALPRLDLPQNQTGAYTDVVVKSRHNLPIADDLVRRDFTVNALAFDVYHQELIDVVGGINDLRTKTLRTVGDPEHRFAEDYSRLLRGLRFAATLNFEFEKKTWRTLHKTMSQINKQINNDYVVPREIVAREFLKSLYLNPMRTIALYEQSGAMSELMPELLLMKKCPQPKDYHSEGDVWVHSLLTVEALFSRRFKKLYPDKPDAELIFTALVHDLGKPATLKTPKRDGVNRVRFDGHDVAGATLAHTMATRLKFSVAPQNSPLHVNPDNVSWLIRHHLLLLNDNARKMKATTLEKYFIAHPLAIKLQQLMLADTLASIPADGRPVVKHLQHLQKALAALPRTSTKNLPKPLLSGTEIMKLLRLVEGPTVGQYLQLLREEQLLAKVSTKREARIYLKQQHGK